jgi:hypothetical protein
LLFIPQSTSLYSPDYQLEVAVHGIIGGAGSRLVANDSLSVLEEYCMGLVLLISSPVDTSLQDNCTVFGVELQTHQKLSVWIIADLDLGDLSLWLFAIQAAPIV